MHTFKIVLAENASLTLNQAFSVLNSQLPELLQDEVDLLALSATLGGVGRQYLSLHHLSLNPAVALKRLGCENTDELLEASSYTCGFLGEGASVCQAIVPLGVVVNDGVPGLQRYHEAFDTYAQNGTGSHLLHLLTDSTRFAPENLKNTFDDGGSLNYYVSRFEQLFLGSGFTRAMLASSRKVGAYHTTLSPVSLSLSNGDMLLAYAYKGQ